MTRLEEALIRLHTDLTDLGVRWALVGGLALAARGVLRMTFDLDVVIAVRGDSEAEALVSDLRARGYATGDLLQQEAVDRLATARLTAPGEGEGGLIVDLLFASSGVEPEVVEAAETLEVLPGFELPVATTAHLIALKLLAARPQDLADAGLLLKNATAMDLQNTREALELISRRGFDRKKDLAEVFSKAVTDAQQT